MGLTPEEILLLHGSAPYDPLKAHEYYLKRRQLKGRKPGSSFQKSKVIKKAPAKSAVQRRKEAQARVAALTARLNRLQQVLALLVKQAKARSGVKPAKLTPAKNSNDKSSKLTAQQKAKAAKQKKDYYEKHKDQSLSQQAKELQAKIRLIEARIKAMRAKLKHDDSVGVM